MFYNGWDMNEEQVTNKQSGVTPKQTVYEEINWELVEHIRGLSVAEKNAWAFAAADFALTQKRLILAKENPDWNDVKIEQEARRQVFGISIEEIS